MSVVQAPELPVQADGAKVLRAAPRVHALVRAVETAAIPARGQPPQRGEIHNVALRLASAGKPRMHAVPGTEKTLVRAGVDHVIPGPRHWNKEVRYLGTRRWR